MKHLIVISLLLGLSGCARWWTLPPEVAPAEPSPPLQTPTESSLPELPQVLARRVRLCANGAAKPLAGDSQAAVLDGVLARSCSSEQADSLLSHLNQARQQYTWPQPYLDLFDLLKDHTRAVVRLRHEKQEIEQLQAETERKLNALTDIERSMSLPQPQSIR